MKHISIPCLLLALLCMPITALAHAKSHAQYDVIAFAGHFFTQPDHLLFMGLAIMIICLCKSSIPERVHRRFFLRQK